MSVETQTPQLVETTTAVGVIFPPPDIRGILDKTAQFVAKNGRSFELRVLAEQSSQKFSFLLPNNPYHAYYEMKVKQFVSGEVEDLKPAVPQAILDMKARQEAKQKKKEEMLMLTAHGEKVAAEHVKPPEPDHFTIRHPHIAAVDLDVIRLTAQFVARNGQKFLIGLTQRERNNPQFAFLRPTHSLFHYFTALVDAYARCLLPAKTAVAKLQSDATDRIALMRRCHHRYAWDSEQEKKRLAQEKEEKEDKAQMAAIDWHDFVVVETVEFTTEDESQQFGAPVDFAAAPPAPVPLNEQPIKPAHTTKDELPMELDMEAPIIGPAPPPIEIRDESPERQKEPEIPVPEIPSQMNIRQDYIRKPKKRREDRMIRCSLSGQLVRESQFSEHVRILLLDPQWKAQRDKLLEKAQKESAYAPAGDVEANLQYFVQKRPDLFGTVEDEIQEHAEVGEE